MSVARTVLLKISDNQWLRANGTRLPFVRRAVSKFMPGESFDDMLLATKATAREGIGAVFTRLGENVKDLAEAEGVARHYLDVIDRIQRAGDFVRAVDQAHPARPRHRSRARLRAPARSRRSRAGGRQLLVGRHGAVLVCRRDARPDAASEAGIPGGGRLSSGLLVSHPAGSRGRPVARHRRAARQGRLQRAGGRGLSEEERRGCELLRAGAADAVGGRAGPQDRARCLARTIWI